jgi:hypothetical protein
VTSCGWCLPSGSHTIKSLSLFQIKHNQIRQDVKDLFLGHRFVSSRVIVKVPMLQLEDKLLGKGRGNVRYQGTNASLPASSAAALPTLSTGPFVVEMAEKMLTRQVFAAVRLQAAARGLLARRRVGWLLDQQLIQPSTPSQFLQAIHDCKRRRPRQCNFRWCCGCRWRRAAS